MEVSGCDSRAGSCFCRIGIGEFKILAIANPGADSDLDEFARSLLELGYRDGEGDLSLDEVRLEVRRELPDFGASGS